MASSGKAPDRLCGGELDLAGGVVGGGEDELGGGGAVGEGRLQRWRLRRRRR